MDSDDWVFAMFMADEERRRARIQAEEEKEELKEEYDQWCIDHGIPPPPEKEPEVHRGAGCLCLAFILVGIAILAITAFVIA
jgi:hypothetical protein